MIWGQLKPVCLELGVGGGQARPVAQVGSRQDNGEMTTVRGPRQKGWTLSDNIHQTVAGLGPPGCGVVRWVGFGGGHPVEREGGVECGTVRGWTRRGDKD